MTNEAEKKSKIPENEDVFASMGNLCGQLEAIETFMARRFDELSMEINATSQQVDMAEEGIAKRFSDILEVLGAISYSGDGTTPANAGVELDAVVDMTEDAANRILDAAGRVSDLADDAGIWSNKAKREEALKTIRTDMNEVIMACSFQDVTGQRIRKTLENLKQIEERLSGTLNKLGISLPEPEIEEKQVVAASQDDVDALFSNEKEKAGQ